MNALVAPSILSADFGNLQDEVNMLNESAADWIHCDIMDGRFVPNISFGFPVLKAIKKFSRKPLDVHLMIAEPEKYIEEFAKSGANLISVHLEACIHLHRTISFIKENGILAGVAINPHSPVVLLQDVITDIDLVCLMSVNPGYGGQKFIPNTLWKLSQLKSLILSRKSMAKIEIDGGVDLDNAGILIEAGADVLVAGNTVFNSPHPAETIGLLKNARRSNTVV
ncbi:MAG: ribulose-phosphate 3-epimerase [Chitinophagales bacterium]|nr:ribulose-phosphate 3-epimerase [Chitinophagales bacterium]